MLINGNMVLGSTLLYRARTLATITYNLTSCVASNQQATISANSSYTTTLTASTTFTYCGVQVLMGGQDITLDCYNIATGTISINRVTGNIVINAEALHEFSNASWFAIKNVAQNNFGATIGWAIGDTKQILIGENTYTVRICDMTQERYEYYSDATKKTNMVFECVELYVNSYARGSTGVVDYTQNTLNTTYLETILPTFPVGLQSLLEMIKIRNTYYTSSGAYNTSYSNVKLFPPSCNEMGTVYGGNPDTAYEYYTEYGVTAKMKSKIGESSYQQWWLRDGGWNQGWENGAIGCVINTSGTVVTRNTTQYWYNDSASVQKSNAVPIFWAW